MKISQEEYEAKRQARYERLLATSQKIQDQAGHLVAQAHDMASFIPFGQPILIGHHSEGRDRRYRSRIENKLRKGYGLYERAEELRERAEAARSNTAIFSDDPAAQEKLSEKISRLEKRQELMKSANKLVRKDDREGLSALGFSPTSIEKLFRPDFAGRIGFADYEITNNGANIRRLKQRLESIQAHASDESTEKEINGIRILDNVDENRLQIFFPGKPSEEIRRELKSRGFRWSPSNNCWQAYRGNNARYWAEQIINKYFGEEQNGK